MKRLLLMIALGAAVSYLGCKQEDGDRCQVDDDCKSGVCNTAKGTCAGGGEDIPIDASLPIDAPTDAPGD